MVGFDDLPMAATTDPPLTTIRQPIQPFGYRAFELLIDLIDNGLSPARKVIMETELIVRASCGGSQ